MTSPDYTSKKDIAYQGIKALILSGKFGSKDPLVERQLCDQLGVSRTPIREALQALANDGLIDIIKGKGVFLRKVNLRDLIEVFELRLALESLAVCLFVERCSQDSIRELRAIFETAEAAYANGNHAKFMECDMRFHQYIAAESKNTRLKETISSNYDRIQLLAVSVRDDEELCAIASQNHAAILTAIEQGDKEAAIKCMGEHINQVKAYHQSRYYLFQ